MAARPSAFSNKKESEYWPVTVSVPGRQSVHVDGVACHTTGNQAGM